MAIHNRGPSLIPAAKLEKAAFFFLFLGVPFIFFFDFLVVTPDYFDTVTWFVLVHYASELYIIINVLGNFYMAIKFELEGVMKIEKSSVEIPGWRYCEECEFYLPPRSYHCKQCNACSLKRDHHCMYLGTCVSYFNLRYFVVAVFHTSIGAIYSLIYYLPYYIKMTNYSFIVLLHVLAPHISIIFGYMTAYMFLLTLFLIMIIAVLFFSSLILYKQMSAIIQGQTQWERKYDVQTYNIGFYKNMKNAFGEKWYLVWVFPTIESPVPK